MAKRSVTAGGKKPVGSVEAISQIFKVDQAMYMKVRMLAAIRRGTGKSSTAQDIYVEAVQEYLERHAIELEGVAQGA
jgi:hypothetical protein